MFNLRLDLLLKVGSWSFEGILVLLIYFLNCRKAPFYEEISKFQ